MEIVRISPRSSRRLGLTRGWSPISAGMEKKVPSAEEEVAQYLFSFARELERTSNMAPNPLPTASPSIYYPPQDNLQGLLGQNLLGTLHIISSGR